MTQRIAKGEKKLSESFRESEEHFYFSHSLHQHKRSQINLIKRFKDHFSINLIQCMDDSDNRTFYCVFFFSRCSKKCSTVTVALSDSMHRNKDLLIMFEHGINVYDPLKCDATKLLTGSAACPARVSSRTMLRLNRRLMITKNPRSSPFIFIFCEAFLRA